MFYNGLTRKDLENCIHVHSHLDLRVVQEVLLDVVIYTIRVYYTQ